VAPRQPGSDTTLELEGADFLGWQSQSFDTDAGPLDVVPLAMAIGGYEEAATVELALGDLIIRAITLDEVIASKEALGRPKDTAALPALYATRERSERDGVKARRKKGRVYARPFPEPEPKQGRYQQSINRLNWKLLAAPVGSQM